MLGETAMCQKLIDRLSANAGMTFEAENE